MTYDPPTAQKDLDYIRENEERYFAQLDDHEEELAKEEQRRDRLNDYGSCGWNLEGRNV